MDLAKEKRYGYSVLAYCYVLTEDDIRTATEIYINGKIKPSKAPQPDYKAKYEKCITVLKKYDAGIIGMYDL